MVMIRKKITQSRQEIPKNEKSFITALGLSDEQKKRFEVLVPNYYLTNYYEMDLVGLRPSGFIDEFEIKLSGVLRPFQRKVQCEPTALYL